MCEADPGLLDLDFGLFLVFQILVVPELCNTSGTFFYLQHDRKSIFARVELRVLHQMSVQRQRKHTIDYLGILIQTHFAIINISTNRY